MLSNRLLHFLFLFFVFLFIQNYNYVSINSFRNTLRVSNILDPYHGFKLFTKNANSCIVVN